MSGLGVLIVIPAIVTIFIIAILTPFLSVCAIISVATAIYHISILDVKIANLQSIFQLGAALCIALTAASPQIIGFLWYPSRRIDTLLDAINALHSSSPNSPAATCMAKKIEILDKLKNYIPLEVDNIYSGSPHHIVLYGALSALNIALLIGASIFDFNISILVAIGLSMLSIAPPLAVPLLIGPKLLRLGAFIEEILRSVRYMQDCDHHEKDRLRRILVDLTVQHMGAYDRFVGR